MQEKSLLVAQFSRIVTPSESVFDPSLAKPTIVATVKLQMLSEELPVQVLVLASERNTVYAPWTVHYNLTFLFWHSLYIPFQIIFVVV